MIRIATLPFITPQAPNLCPNWALTSAGALHSEAIDTTTSLVRMRADVREHCGTSRREMHHKHQRAQLCTYDVFSSLSDDTTGTIIVNCHSGNSYTLSLSSGSGTY